MTLPALESAAAVAALWAQAAAGVHNLAREALMGREPSADEIARVQLCSQVATIAAHEHHVAEYRAARYRIAARGWRWVSAADRQLRRPGVPAWTLQRFAAHHGFRLTPEIEAGIRADVEAHQARIVAWKKAG